MQFPRLVLWLAGGALVAGALGQPAPKLNSLSPDWIQRGTTIEVVFTGDNLGEVTGFLFDGDAGLSATNVPPPAPPRPTITVESTGGGISRAEPAPTRDSRRLVAKVTATADASLAPREVRVVSAGGVSNPLLLHVGQWPEVPKRDPNGTLADAQPVTLPAVISGLLNTVAQTNHFRFKAARGEELVFEIDAARRGSPLDSSLAVLDASGKELARNEDALGLDSLLFFTAPADGEYILQLRDYRFRGGNDYRYRLTAGPVPYVEAIFPFGGQRGKSVEVALTGRNLEGATKMTLNIDAKAPRGRQEIRLSTPRGHSNLVPFDVQDFPDLAEAEPNDIPDKANSVTAPVVINGRIGQAGDVDYFKFKPDKDQKIVCSVAASQFGSALDALLTLSDASGKLIQQNDDSAGADARLEFDARKDAEYVLALRDLTERGGGNFAYRLAIRPPSAAAESGFSVSFLPDAVRVHRGGRTKVRCEVTRQAGFDRPVCCEFEGLPPGVYAEPLLLPAGQPGGLMTLAAVEDCALGTHPLQLRASGVAGGKAIVRVAQPLNGEAPVRRGYVTVLEAAPYTLELASLSAAAEQGQPIQIEVLARR
ncbi:MAG TPA: PPC domain-containing protein, partial [Methylomirabilota bacterium]|nr:PPC domain-containing protein [Methylomirabilota bacterium]